MRRGRERRILTPEHVPVHLVPAGLGGRFLALMADAAVILGLSAVVSMLFSVLPFGIGAAVGATIAFLVTWGYHVFFEVYRGGRTPGKRLAGLRVVDGRGLPLTLEQSLVRNIARVLDFLPVFYGLGGLVCLLDSDRRRLGDIAADTLVIREERGRELRGELPVGARRHNSLLDPATLRRIRHRVGLEEREFLLALVLRAEHLEDGARYDLMEKVGEAYRHKLEIDDPHLSGENLVRGLVAVLFG